MISMITIRSIISIISTYLPSTLLTVLVKPVLERPAETAQVKGVATAASFLLFSLLRTSTTGDTSPTCSHSEEASSRG